VSIMSAQTSLRTPDADTRVLWARSNFFLLRTLLPAMIRMQDVVSLWHTENWRAKLRHIPVILQLVARFLVGLRTLRVFSEAE
jgi:hypothetical protein